LGGVYRIFVNKSASFKSYLYDLLKRKSYLDDQIRNPRTCFDFFFFQKSA